MTGYFLTPKLYYPGQKGASGGAISNYHLICMLSNLIDLKTASILPFNGDSDAFDNLDIYLPDNVSNSRSTFFYEKYFNYRNRVEKLIVKYGKGPVFATRATIPTALKISRKYKLPLILIVRAFEDFEQAKVRPKSDKISLYRRFDGFLNRQTIIKAYQSANMIITNSHYMENQISECFKTKSKVVVLYPVVDIPKKKPSFSEINQIGFINKGSRKGKEIIEKLAKCFPDVRFLIYGFPFKNIDINTNIINMGYESDREKLFSSADLFLVPSIWDEPFGRVAAEAIWSGRPVLVSNKGGLPEAASADLFKVKSDESKDWVASIKTIANNQVDTNNNIKNSQEHLQMIASKDSNKKRIREIISYLKRL